jgi:glycolate oxidase iron-sulfur subunit
VTALKAELFREELDRCTRCGTCKTLCPTYLFTHDEAMGARGRVAMLGALIRDDLKPTRGLADRIYSCTLCEACRGLCPVGIDIPEVIYNGRALLKRPYKRGRLLRKAMLFSLKRMDMIAPFAKIMQKGLYNPLRRLLRGREFPDITARPFKNRTQVYKLKRKTARAAIFAGCNVNYFYPELGEALSRVLLGLGYEVVVFRGELCCGAPLRSLGLQDEAAEMARRNMEHFNRVRAEFIISLCPTCTMVIRNQYPLIAGGTIGNIMDLSEFLAGDRLPHDLELPSQVVTYHDPCHLNFGLGIRAKPREIIGNIGGLELREMSHPQQCCGFAGLFSLHFRSLSESISRSKMEDIRSTGASTVVTSCPGCIMQMETTAKSMELNLRIMHLVELVDEAMNR